MLRHDPNYLRLPGGGRTIVGQASYWLARDHLLVVEVQFATERYRRFDLAEIQTVIARRTQDLKWRGTLLLTVTLALLVPLFFQIEIETMILLSVFAAVSGVGFLVDCLLGHTSRADLRTAVQTFRLPGLTRWRRTEQFLAALAPAVQAAQVGLAPVPEEITRPEPDATATRNS